METENFHGNMCLILENIGFEDKGFTSLVAWCTENICSEINLKSKSLLYVSRPEHGYSRYPIQEVTGDF